MLNFNSLAHVEIPTESGTCWKWTFDWQCPLRNEKIINCIAICTNNDEIINRIWVIFLLKYRFYLNSFRFFLIRHDLFKADNTNLFCFFSAVLVRYFNIIKIEEDSQYKTDIRYSWDLFWISLLSDHSVIWLVKLKVFFCIFFYCEKVLAEKGAAGINISFNVYA